MKLFAGIDVRGGDKTIAAAFRAIGDRVETLPAPRSFCEVGADTEDYHWLCSWAWSLKPQTALTWLTEYPQGSGDGGSRFIGGLLLFLAAEAARREAREGFVWPAVHERFHPETRRLLFAQGQPTQLYKEAIEATARLLKLRHVFGLEGTQNYYVSIYVQFGFTQKGLAQLPFWLAGHAQTKAIQYLLGSPFSSETFRKLWSALRNYRQNNIAETRLRQILESSPWVLPEWGDELVLRARERPDLGTVSSDHVEADAEQPLSFLGQPRFQWEPPADPRFMSELTNLVALGLSEKHYVARGGNNVLATLLRQPDETYLCPESVSLPCDVAQPVITLVGDSGALHASLQLDLWESTEDVTVFELPSGRRLNAWQDPMSPKKTYVLLTAPDLKIDPPPSVWRLIAGQSRQLSLLPTDWSLQLQVLLDGEVLWTPYLGTGRRPIAAEPAWTRAVLPRPPSSEVALGQPLQLLIVGLTQDIMLDFVRLGTRPLEFEQNGETAKVKARITPEVAASELNLTLGLRQGNERVRVRRTMHLGVAGATRFTERGWETLNPRGELTVQEAQTYTYKLFLPNPWGSERLHELALLEGSTYSRRLWQKPQPLGKLAGFGAPLVIRGPYNWTENTDVLTLARTVVDPGIVGEVECEEDCLLRIHLRLPIEPGSQHQVVCWSEGDQPDILPSASITVLEQTCWQVNYRPSNPSRLIVAVAYAGVRLGAWWPARLDEVLDPPVAGPSSPTTTAALIRWMHLPILSPSFLHTISAFARHHPAETLAAWLLDKGLSEALSFAAIGEEWMAAIRQVFADWFPEPEQTHAIVKTLSVDSAAQPLWTAARWLMRVDPLLMGRVVRSWFKDIDSSSREQSLAAAQIQALQHQLARLSENASDKDLRNRQEEILDQAATVMQVDSGFLESGIVRRAVETLTGGSLSLLDSTNLGVALAVAPLREYLGLRILGEVVRRL